MVQFCYISTNINHKGQQRIANEYTEERRRVLGQGLKSECADIFHQNFLWLLRHTDEPQKGRNSCLWLQSRSVLSFFGVVLMPAELIFT